MKKIQRILAAIDLSSYSKEILAQATRLARSMDARVIIANVINKRDIEVVKEVYKPMTEHYASPYSSVYLSLERYVEDVKQKRREHILGLIEEVEAGDVIEEILFSIGVPFDELITLAESHNVDLIVIGPKGRTDLPHTLFGTTAEKMFRHCPLPMLSVRTGDFPEALVKAEN